MLRSSQPTKIDSMFYFDLWFLFIFVCLWGERSVVYAFFFCLGRFSCLVLVVIIFFFCCHRFVLKREREDEIGSIRGQEICGKWENIIKIHSLKMKMVPTLKVTFLYKHKWRQSMTTIQYYKKQLNVYHTQKKNKTVEERYFMRALDEWIRTEKESIVSNTAVQQTSYTNSGGTKELSIMYPTTEATWKPQEIANLSQ